MTERCQQGAEAGIEITSAGFLRLILMLALFSVFSPALGAPAASQGPKEFPGIPPRPIREFRGVWVATVGNTDWPSKPGLPSAQQKAELTAIFDKAVQLRLNAVILQVRPMADAFYASPHEPWSEYLTGQMGRAPEPYYDPLAFAVEQAHMRGLELHAWFNPFRVRHAAAKPASAANHLSRAKAHAVRQYQHLFWADPGDRGMREHSTKVILDVLERYDVDGIHLDDYFYPYKVKDAKTQKWHDFPDEATWKQYQKSGGKLSRGDWRRKNVDDFVANLYAQIKKRKPWVKFGISPFGIWRPGHPAQIQGLDSYDSLYADSRKWLVEGWLDYCAPQLYWPIAAKAQSYPALLEWWVGQNALNRHVWVGNNSAEVGKTWKQDEILNQVKLTRSQPGASGNIYWNASSLMENRDGLASSLQKRIYQEPALPPASPWLGGQAPGKPSVRIETQPSRTVLKWMAGNGERPWLWVCQTRVAAKWETRILPGASDSLIVPVPKGRDLELAAVTAINRVGMAGPTALTGSEGGSAMVAAP